MADTKNINPQASQTNQPNQTMRQENAKAEVSGQPRQDERDKLDQERHDKGAVGSEWKGGAGKSEEFRQAEAGSQTDKTPPTGQQR